MRKHITNLGLISSALALAVLGSSTVFALPSQARVHAATTPPASQQANGSAAQAGNGQANRQAAMLRVCQNRQNAINNIINRIDTRATNQLTLFSTIASRVEAFYTKQGKTISDYSSLVAAVDSAQTKASNDLTTLKTNSSFTCSSTNPKGMVLAFQTYLKTAITDLKSFKTAVKNLIVGVATANGVKLSANQGGSTTSSTTQTGTQTPPATTPKGGN